MQLRGKKKKKNPDNITRLSSGCLRCKALGESFTVTYIDLSERGQKE